MSIYKFQSNKLHDTIWHYIFSIINKNPRAPKNIFGHFGHSGEFQHFEAKGNLIFVIENIVLINIFIIL